MTSTPGRPPSQPARRSGHVLPSWMGTVFPIGLLVSAALAAVAHANQTFLPAVLQATLAMGVGVTTGFVTRRSTRGRSATVQWWIATGVATICLLAVGLLFGGGSGIASPVLGSPHARLADLGWIVLSGTGAALALRFRRARPPRPPRITIKQRAQATWAGLRLRWQRSSPARAWRRLTLGDEKTRPRPAPITNQTPTPASPGRSRARLTAGNARTNSTSKAKPGKRSRQKAAPSLLRAARRAARRGIRFTGNEEARCPYCLEPVQSNDPRGSKVCPICHTRHHADCWAVTGVCQMPHLYVDDTPSRQGANR